MIDAEPQKTEPVDQNSTAKLFGGRWILKKKLSSGSFGVVFIGYDQKADEYAAIKLERQDSEEIQSLEREVSILLQIQGIPNIPSLLFYGRQYNYNIVVTQLLGRDLSYYMNKVNKFCLQTVIFLGLQLIQIIKNIHEKKVIHRDIKPENLVLGRGQESEQLFMIDFGISKMYKDQNNKHISQKSGKSFLGTTRYASIKAHQGQELSRRDDLESIAYVLAYLLRGELPWQNLKVKDDDERIKKVGEIKQQLKSTDLFKDFPLEFSSFLDYSKNLEFNQDPDYNYILQLFSRIAQNIDLDLQEYYFEWQKKKKSTLEKSKTIVTNEHNRQRNQSLEFNYKNTSTKNISAFNSTFSSNFNNLEEKLKQNYTLQKQTSNQAHYSVNSLVNESNSQSEDEDVFKEDNSQKLQQQDDEQSLLINTQKKDNDEISDSGFKQYMNEWLDVCMQTRISRLGFASVKAKFKFRLK